MMKFRLTAQRKDVTAKTQFLFQNYEEFVSDVKNIDDDVADVINERKNDFYDEYYYLKPECEKSGWEKFTEQYRRFNLYIFMR